MSVQYCGSTPQHEEMDLEDQLQEGPFSKLEAILLALGIAKAVVVIHSKNFIHRHQACKHLGTPPPPPLP